MEDRIKSQNINLGEINTDIDENVKSTKDKDIDLCEINTNIDENAKSINDNDNNDENIKSTNNEENIKSTNGEENVKSTNTDDINNNNHKYNSCDYSVLYDHFLTFYNDDNKNNTKLMDLDHLILLNDYDKIKLAVDSGSTLFHDNKICNGLYVKQFGKHPKECKNNVCHRTSLYYALKNNCKAYISIYFLISKLQKEVPELRKLCSCCKIKTDKKYRSVSNKLNSVIYGLWDLKCECSDKQVFHKLYSNKYLNFSEIYILLNTEMPKILIYLTKLFPFTKDVNLSESEFNLQEFNFCMHDHMKKFILNTEHLKNRANFDQSIVQNIIIQLHICYKYYEENSKICTLLFNQQSLETFKYYTDNKCTDNLLQKTISLLYDMDYINVNYCNEQCTTPLNMCIQNGLDGSVIDFIKIGANDISDDVFFDALGAGYYTTCFNCVEIFGVTKLTNYEKNIGYLLVTESTMDIELKNNFLNKIFSMGYMPSNDVLNVAIQMPNHDIIVRTLLSKLKPTLDDAYVTIRKNKPQILDMLLEFKLDVNMSDDHHDPLIFSCLTNIEMLNILLKYECDINITNKNNLTPLWEASIKGEIEIVQILLEHGGNYLVIDNDENSCMMIGIKNEQYIYPMIGKKNKDDNYLINYQNNVGYTALILSVYSQNVLKFITNLSQYKYINFNHVDKNGMNVIDHLIDNTKLAIHDKIKALEILLDDINFALKPSNGKPFLVRAVESQEYEIAKYIFEYLISTKKIELLFNDKVVKSLEKSFQFKNVKVKIHMDYEIDIYTIVYNYLKQVYISGQFKTTYKCTNWYITCSIVAIMLYSSIKMNTNKKLIGSRC